MNSGMFYKGVRFVVTSAALLAVTPAFAMSVYLGQVAEVRATGVTVKVVGAKLLDANHVELDLQDQSTGEVQTMTVENQGDSFNIPELVPPPRRNSGSLPLLY